MDSDETLHEGAAAERRPGSGMLSDILNSLNDAVITVGHDHRISSFNRAAERIVGIPAGEAIGSDCRRVLRASFGPHQHECPMGELIEGGVPRSNVDGTLVRADGRIVPVSASWAFFRNEAGAVLGFVISFRDFEEIERIAEERKGRHSHFGIIGKAPGIRRIFDLVDVVKGTDSTVLITGESGTGKGLFARAIHDLSPRRDRPFVKVNCASLTETLLESELFGHVKGAFTGAVADRAGRFEAAEGGTVFLDEIGEISPAVQVKLLRFLQEREFERVGSNKTQVADVRVIAATNRDLKGAMRERAFREDLYYRLNVIPIVVPPLRERREDIPLLVEQVLKRLRSRGLERVRAVSPDAMRRLMEYSWPGNVRELENVVERGVVCARGAVLSGQDLPEEVGAAFPPPPAGVPEAGAPPPAVGAPDEKGRLLAALEAQRWNRARAARELGIDRSTLWRKMKKLGLG